MASSWIFSQKLRTAQIHRVRRRGTCIFPSHCKARWNCSSIPWAAGWTRAGQGKGQPPAAGGSPCPRKRQLEPGQGLPPPPSPVPGPAIAPPLPSHGVRHLSAAVQTRGRQALPHLHHQRHPRGTWICCEGEAVPDCWNIARQLSRASSEPLCRPKQEALTHGPAPSLCWVLSSAPVSVPSTLLLVDVGRSCVLHPDLQLHPRLDLRGTDSKTSTAGRDGSSHRWAWLTIPALNSWTYFVLPLRIQQPKRIEEFQSSRPASAKTSTQALVIGE